ncbi:hypothetical protein BKN14_00455 [Candidatus Gracilibacteria bacterium HOT-871]|nr:hypothetical protein BKN14_00455 [Candidatus Gracilibacteria bacterium HOT-871]
MTKIKLNCYDKNGKFKKQISNVENIDSLEFSEITNGGQGRFSINLVIPFDRMDYEVGDFIEYSVIDEEYKKGLHKYTGVIRGIERYFSITDGEGIRLQVEGLVSLLSDFETDKIYSGNLFNAINEFISDFHNHKNISNKMQFLGTSIFKNGYKRLEKIKDLNGTRWIDYNGRRWSDNFSDMRNITIPPPKTRGKRTFFKILEEFFGENYHFFINQRGEIILIEEQKNKRVLTLNKNISEININTEGEIIIDLINIDKGLQVGDFIILQNINKKLNLNGKRIQELAFGLNNITINAGKIVNYKNI